jgi:tRNA threonylcarbamoyladenosine biosynthesis protein TsaB
VHSLFIDSTSGLEIGLLDSSFNWIEYHSYNEKKPSEVIHSEVYSLVKKYNLELSSMRLFVTSGPGSYTGMRLSEGLAQIFEMSGLSVFSFFHFEVPFLCGIKNGFWATNAFKGQVFIYSWNGEENEKTLVDKKDFVIDSAKLGYTLDKTDVLFEGLSATKELIHNESHKLFSKVLELQLRVPPFYFRTLEEEFR